MQSFNQTETVGAAPTVSPAEAAVILSGTLEEECVEKMAPLVGRSASTESSYKPVLDGQHGASPLEG